MKFENQEKFTVRLYFIKDQYIVSNGLSERLKELDFHWPGATASK